MTKIITKQQEIREQPINYNLFSREFSKSTKLW